VPQGKSITTVKNTFYWLL